LSHLYIDQSNYGISINANYATFSANIHNVSITNVNSRGIDLMYIGPNSQLDLQDIVIENVSSIGLRLNIGGYYVGVAFRLKRCSVINAQYALYVDGAGQWALVDVENCTFINSREYGVYFTAYAQFHARSLIVSGSKNWG
jgi:hypothetical protein